METPVYLVQVNDETQYGYWDKNIMKVDMMRNKEEGRVKIFKVVEGSLVLKYRQINEDEI
jgi:hypothetical protein